MNKYAWDFDIDSEFWNNGTFDSVEECIEDAIQYLTTAIDDSDEYPKLVYIGNVREFVPKIGALHILERLEEQAQEECGEIGEDWDAYHYDEKERIAELEDALNKVVIDWLTKYNRMPNFYTVENIMEYPLNIDAGEGRN